MLIRRFKLGDETKISYLIKCTVYLVNSVDYPASIIEKARLDNTPSKIIKKSRENIVYVAVKDKKIMGTATLAGNKVEAVYVHPRYHSLGVGKKLMEKLEEQARSKGYTKLILYASITAVGFYEKLKYKKIKKVSDGPYGENVYFTKKI